MVRFEERDVFMSHVHQQEIRDRMQGDMIDVPQLFVDGQYIGVSKNIKLTSVKALNIVSTSLIKPRKFLLHKVFYVEINGVSQFSFHT